MSAPRFGAIATLGAVFLAAAAAARPSPTTTPRASAPTVAPTPAAATAADRSAAPAGDARALFAKAVESLGGRERIEKIRDVRTRGQVTARTAQGEMTMEMDTTIAFPDRLSQQVDAPFGRFAMVATPGGAFLVGSQGVQDLPAPIRDELLHQVQRSAFYLAQKIGDPKLDLRLGAAEKLGDVETRILDVSYAGAAVRWFIDPATGRILRSAHDSMSPDGKTVHVLSDYSDFRAAEGFTLPHTLSVVTDGSPDQIVVLDEIHVNAGVDPKLFEKPAPAPQTTGPPGAPTNPPRAATRPPGS